MAPLPASQCAKPGHVEPRTTRRQGPFMYRALDDFVIAKPDAMERYVHAYTPRRGPCCEAYVWQTMINISMTAVDLSHHAILDFPFAGEVGVGNPKSRSDWNFHVA